MGGPAFKEHGLSTPRMPPAVYHFALKQIEGKLSMLFRRVAHCIEGPGKTDYGDLDILALPDFGKPVPSLNDISVLLNAKSYNEGSNGVIAPAISGPAEAASPQAIAKRPAPWVGHLTAQSKSRSTPRTLYPTRPPNLHLTTTASTRGPYSSTGSRRTSQLTPTTHTAP